jgi:PAS domain S-box-containing protein
MNKQFILQLIFNASLLLSLALLYDLFAVRWRPGKRFLLQAPAGVIIGFVGVIVMLASWKHSQGIVFDTRSILLGVSGLYFGTVPTLVAMAGTAAYRTFMAGPAAGMGVAVIVSSGVIGLAWRYRRRERLADLSWGELLLFGFSVHLAMLGCTAFLPRALRGQVLANIYLPVLLAYPAVTAVLGKLMAGRLRRERTQRSLAESEARYQTLADMSPVGIFRTDPAGRTTYVNPMWCRISGMDRGSALGDGWLDAVHPDDRDSLRSGWHRAAGAHSSSAADYRFLRPDGSIVWVMGEANPVKDAAGETTGYVGTITDISSRKRDEETVRSSLAEKEILLQEVHHRVKNNLMTIIGLIRMQELKTEAASSRELFRELEGRIHSMAIVHEGLYVSKSLSRINLQDYIKKMAAHLEGQYSPRQPVHLRTRAVGIELPLDIAVPCGLILNEMISNSFKHAIPAGRPPDGEPLRIEVEARVSDGSLVLTVADNGAGFPPSFDPEKAGTLGLRLIHMLGQQVRGKVERMAGPGAAVRVSIPLPASQIHSA